MTEEEIKKIYQEYRVPHHVIKHMQAVADFAVDLGEKFQKKGYRIDLKTLKYAALLHDFLRVCDFCEMNLDHFSEDVNKDDLKFWQSLRDKYGKKGHEKAAFEVLEEMGKKEIANLVKMHDFWKVDELKSLEEKILFYADKRVEENRVVDLETRFKNGRIRNKVTKEFIQKRNYTEEKTRKLERYLLKKLS
jgi:HD superfamily phosphodiesterase